MKLIPDKFAACFALTREERLLLGGILAIALIGLAARYYYWKCQKPEAFQPEGVGQLEPAQPPPMVKHPAKGAAKQKPPGIFPAVER